MIRWAMRKLDVEEWLVSAVMSMYTGAKTVVGTVYGNSNSFEVKVGMQQGSALSPLLCLIVKEALSREFKDALPWELWSRTYSRRAVKRLCVCVCYHGSCTQMTRL